MVLPRFSYRVFMVLGLMFKSLIHLELILVKAFSASIEIILWFLSLVLFMWWITFIDLRMLNQPCISGMKPTSLWWISFLMCFWQSVCQYFIEDFWIYVHRGYWPKVFLSCWVSVWFWYQIDVGLIKWFGKDSLFFGFFGIVSEGMITVPLCVSDRIRLWTQLDLGFFCVVGS